MYILMYIKGDTIMIEEIKIGEVLSVKEARDKLPKLVKSNKVSVITRRGKISSAIVPTSMLRDFLGEKMFKEFLFEIYLREEAERRIKKVSKEERLETIPAEEALEKLKK